MAIKAKIKPNEKPPRISPKQRIALGAILLLLVIWLVVYLSRDKYHSHVDPNIGKSTDVVIEGTVSCNGQLMPGGYVVAWQNGPPVAFAPVREDGSYRMVNAPLGKCFITYSATAPLSVAPHDDHNLHEAPPEARDALPPGSKGGLAGKGKEGGEPKNKGSEPKSKKGEPKKKEGGMGGKDRPSDPMAGPEVGRTAPVNMQNLSPEDRKLVDSVSAKYADPSKNALQFETKHGHNSLNLTLRNP